MVSSVPVYALSIFHFIFAFLYFSQWIMDFCASFILSHFFWLIPIQLYIHFRCSGMILSCFFSKANLAYTYFLCCVALLRSLRRCLKCCRYVCCYFRDLREKWLIDKRKNKRIQNIFLIYIKNNDWSNTLKNMNEFLFVLKVSN